MRKSVTPDLPASRMACRAPWISPRLLVAGPSTGREVFLSENQRIAIDRQLCAIYLFVSVWMLNQFYLQWMIWSPVSSVSSLCTRLPIFGARTIGPDFSRSARHFYCAIQFSECLRKNNHSMRLSKSLCDCRAPSNSFYTIRLCLCGVEYSFEIIYFIYRADDGGGNANRCWYSFTRTFTHSSPYTWSNDRIHVNWLLPLCSPNTTNSTAMIYSTMDRIISKQI